jgi:Uncharacterized conserved protein
MNLVLQQVSNIPIIQPGDDLGKIISASLKENSIQIRDNDILVVTQKIVSKSEGRFVNIEAETPSSEALRMAAICEKDPAVGGSHPARKQGSGAL